MIETGSFIKFREVAINKDNKYNLGLLWENWLIYGTDSKALKKQNQKKLQHSTN